MGGRESKIERMTENVNTRSRQHEAHTGTDKLYGLSVNPCCHCSIWRFDVEQGME